jgi:tetratricopeptide (TPR) repeat protein
LLATAIPNEWLEWLDDLRTTGNAMEMLEKQIAEGENLETISASQAQIDELGAELRRTLGDLQHQLHQAIWTGPSGEHLRAARERNWDELFEAIDVAIPGTDIVIEYYPCVIGNLRVIDMLDELGEYLPTSKRASFYHLIGMGFCNGSIRPAGATWFEYDIKWFEKAARWADMVTDHWELFSLFTHLSGAYQEMKPPDYPAALKSVLEGYSHLIHLNNRDDEYGYWLGHIPGPRNWDPGDDWPVVQRVIEAALDQNPFEKSLSAIGGRGLGHFAVWGARTAMRGGYKQQALRYLLSAREIDPDYSAVAELLAEIYLDESDLKGALEEYRRVIAVDPANAQAKRLIPILEQAQEGSLTTQARDLILQVLPELRAGQEVILEELSLQRGLMEKMAEAQKAALREVERSRNEDRAERTYDELLEQLHRLVQEGSRIQPAAWRAARAGVAEELGPKIFNGLRAEDSRHFLLTAEVFLAASRDVAAMDAAPIAVEYAKVVETELQKRFLTALEDHLESRADTRNIRCGRKTLTPVRDSSWKGAFQRLGLGDMSYLLNSIANGENDSVLGAYLRSRGIHAQMLKSIGDDLLKISTTYRNGAAHTHRLTRENLLEFRALLFNSENGLLKRLVELGRRVEAENPQG